MAIPIACTLTAGELRTRRDQLLPGLADRAERIEVLPRTESTLAGGSRVGRIQLRFAPSPAILGDIAAVVERERRCCKFLAFELAIEADDGPITLTITAPADATPFLEELLGITGQPLER